MQLPLRRWAIAALLVVVLLFLLTSAAAIVLTEVVLHPLLRRRSSDTASLAYNIARSSGATAQKVIIYGNDGVLLDAWWLTPQRQTERSVMVCHGVADSAFGVLGYALLFLRNGYSVLVPESRGHGESQGYVTYGVLEAEDTVRWLGWMKSHGVKSAFGFGESLGAAILLQSLAKGADFRAVVAESSYSSFETVAEERVGHVLGRVVALVLVDDGILYANLRYGVNLRQARPDLAIKQTRVPVLLIHGLEDHETTPEHSKRIAAESGTARLWLVPNARHTGAYAVQPQQFEDQVLKWFEQPD